MAKQLHFNKNGEALKRMQAGVDKLASVVGVTLGPKVKTYHICSSQFHAFWID
jgi:chaperonin GroEL (HSP60 family)